jgi:hypothetical protein
MAESPVGHHPITISLYQSQDTSSNVLEIQYRVTARTGCFGNDPYIRYEEEHMAETPGTCPPITISLYQYQDICPGIPEIQYGGITLKRRLGNDPDRVGKEHIVN